MKSTSLSFRIITVIGVSIFITVQFFLIYNTYRVALEHFFRKEKDIINNEYSRAITNDRLYPGGQKIIDSIYLKKIDTLEILYNSNRKKFAEISEIMMDSIFLKLKEKNNVQSLLDSIIKKNHKIATDFKYALVINRFEISLKNFGYVQLYPFNNKNIERYELIGGEQSSINASNTITSLTISSTVDKSNKITFQLYVEPKNKKWSIIKKMLPTFLLSLASVSTIVLLFIITINNWLKQKKLAEMQFDFINSISHEFNTPLTAIIIANKTLQNEKIIPQSEKLINITDIIQRQTARLNALFKRTLHTTKSNQSFVNKQEEFLFPSIEKIVGDYKTNLNENTTIQLKSEISPDRKLYVDLFWFTTMIQNLIDNGIKYNNNIHKKIAITLTEKESQVILCIEDNGIGMSSETIKRIFNKFYRHNDKSTKAGGLGLGLYYVQECIKMHSWKIKVESSIGRGSKFIVTLP